MNFEQLKLVYVPVKDGTMISIQEDFGQDDDPELSIAGCWNPSSKGVAYAKLFAAAPDLLKALQAYVDEAAREGNKSPEVDNAKVAIAKVFGEQ